LLEAPFLEEDAVFFAGSEAACCAANARTRAVCVAKITTESKIIFSRK